jgi:tetratricopeptide (TPR) repeat protein
MSWPTTKAPLCRRGSAALPHDAAGRGSRLAIAVACIAASALSLRVDAATAPDYSQQLDALWSFDRPALSEQRFRAEAAKHAPRSREAVEAATQIARAQGLQRKFGDADLTLDAVQATLDAQPARVRVRYLLERGRRDNSSERRTSAIAWFEQALAASANDTLPGASYYRVDALHMLAIASPAEQQLEWNKRAIAAAQSSDDARTRRWRTSLFNNIGWTMHDRGDFVAALDYWRQALAAAEQDGQDATRTRIGRWTVARGLRSLGRLDEAEAMQRALADELQAAQVPDGYVFEELAEIAVARGDRAAARPWAAKALELLRNDADFVATQPERLARLADLAEPGPPR